MKLLVLGGAALAAVGAVEIAVATAIAPSPIPCGFTDATIVIGGGVILSIIAGIGKVWTDVIAGNRETAKVHALVNGQRGEILNEMAALKRLVAELSNRRDDRIRADASQKAADNHKAIVEEAKKP